jgi:GntR family transcriptional regulator/MocR family aminotransferase
VADSRTNLAWETLFDLSATRPGPLHRRLAEAIRAAIRGGRVPLGAALPPSRVLAADLKVSRWTVTQAYGQLITEGFLSGKTGSATRVSWSPEPDERRAQRPPTRGHAHGPARYDLSQCTPDYRGFPRRKWAEAIRVAAETAPYDRLGYPAPGGEERLRAALADQLDRRRGARVEPGLTTVFTGARQAMGALCQALVEDGHRRLAVEDPGSPGMWDGAAKAGLELVGLPVDERGLRVDALDGHPDVRAVCVGPAHHVATGAVLSPERRAALLDWANRVDGLVIEDDYDSEFCYDGPALPTMQGVDPHRVALLGSMSRTMTPTANVGWVVTPRRWIDAVHAALRSSAAAPPALNQIALAHFLESGAYDRHLRSSRQRFRSRRDILLAELARRLPAARVTGQQSGLHFLLRLPEGLAAGTVIAAAAQREMELCDLSPLYRRATADEDLLQVGYGNLSDSLAAEAAELLVELILASA